jgi:superfamily II DNA or RNA helicase
MSRLRPYQIQLVDSLKQAWREGFKSPCIVAPCGAGKSVIAAEIAKRTTWRGNRVLFLVHRRELCEQIERTFRSWDVVMPLCTIGMVQTVTRRLERQEAPALIITDENHHCLAKSYKRVYGHFSAARRVGITATPTRLNGGGLGDINDKLIEGPSVKWLIDNNYLAPFDYYSPTVADLSGVNRRILAFRSTKRRMFVYSLWQQNQKRKVYHD